jgi:hypothetical protein
MQISSALKTAIKNNFGTVEAMLAEVGAGDQPGVITQHHHHHHHWRVCDVHTMLAGHDTVEVMRHMPAAPV